MHSRSVWLTGWALLLAVLIGGNLLATVSRPSEQETLALSAQDAQLPLLWLRDDPQVPEALKVAVLPNLKDLIAQYQKVYQTARRATTTPEEVILLRLKLGLLYAKTGQLTQALDLWQQGQEAGQVLESLFASSARRVLPDSEVILRANLKGWYLTESLEQLAHVQKRSTQALLSQKQAQADTLFKQSLWLNLFQLAALLVGLFLLVREIFFWQQQKRSWGNVLPAPWSWDDGILVILAWLTGAIFLGLGVGLGLKGWLDQVIAAPDLAFAVLVFVSKSLDTLLALGLIILVLARKHVPVFAFGLSRLSWGLGGYLAALPLVLGMSLITQKIVAGGGGNPLLTSIADSKSPWAVILLFFTVAFLAPVAEECLFRGVLFPTLAQRWGIVPAIVVSGLVFGAIHMSAAEFLPLATLGMILAYVYQQSRNLASSIMLHMLFNSVTFGTLLVLGS